MRLPSFRCTLAVFALLFASTLAYSANVYAQQPSTTPTAPTPPASTPSTPSSEPSLPTLPGQTSTTATAEPPKVDPEEEAAYKAFTDTKPTEDDKRIQMGTAFVTKYPNSLYVGKVYGAMAQAEYDKQDVPKIEEDGEKALAANPDDVSTLILMGQVIPRTYNPNEPNADKQLDKAEAYEKHALAVVSALQKPATMTDDQFSTLKADAETQAHSALGLVYFRKQNLEGCVSELSLSTQNVKSPDATDFYVLGVCQRAKKDFNGAADSFTKCAALPGGLQARCKGFADDAKKLATAAPAK